MLAPTKKAEAGIVVTGVGYEICVTGVGNCSGISMGLVTLVGGISLMYLVPNGWGVFGGTILIVLDIDNSVNQGILEQAFAKSYPFIDNNSVIRNLAQMIKKKAPDQMAQDKKYLISLTEKEIQAALDAIDLTTTQIRQVVNDHK